MNGNAITVQEAIYRMRLEGQAAVDAASRSVDGLAVSEEKLTRATRASEQGFERLLARLDPAARAHQQYERTIEQIQRYEAAGIGTAQQRAQAMAIATARFESATKAVNVATVANDNFAKATGLGAFQVSNLGFQLNDIATGLASGQSPFTILAQQSGQVYQILSTSEKGVGGALKGIGQQLLALITPGRALVLGFTAVGAAAYGLYRVFRTEGPTVTETLDEQARLLGVIKTAYGDAAVAAGKFLDQSKAVTTLQAQQNLLQLQLQLQAQARQATSTLTRPTSVPSEIPLDNIEGVIADAAVGATNFAALNREIEKFNAGARSAADVQAFRDAIAAIGVAAAATDPELAKVSLQIISDTKQLGELAAASLKAAAGLRLLQGIGTKGDRELLGLKDTVNAYDQLIQRTEDRIKELELEALTVGQVEGAVMKLRLQHEAERAAKAAGRSVDQEYLDGLKERLAITRQLTNESRLRADIQFERDQFGRTDMEQNVASRLRGAGLSVDLSSPEAEMIRLNEQLKLGKELATDFASSFVRDLRGGATAIDALNNALTRLADRLLDMAVQNLVARALGGLVGSFVGGGGLGAGGIGLPGGTATGGLYHSGGMASEPSGKRMVHAAYFEMAPRFHSGRIGSDEMPAIIRRDESVLTPGQMRAIAGAGRSTKVEIHNYSGADISQETGQTGDGQEFVRVVVGSVRKDMGQGGFDKTMQRRLSGPIRR